MQKVCIIGAGSSGLVAAKTLKEHHIPFDCFEAGSDIGGNWRYMNDNGMSSAYRSLHINTSKKMMAYSDFPMPDTYPHFPHHSQILAYFEEYADHFDLKKHIQFKTKVTLVKKNTDGTYQVTTQHGKTQNYYAVLVCSGHHWNPRYPEPPFAGNFEGETLHSHDYKEPSILENKNILIVGIGNSAIDIACEAARLHQGKVFLSTRSGAYIMPNYILGKPFDELGKDVPYWLPMPIKRKILDIALWIARGRQEDYGVPKPKRPLLSEHPTLSQDFLNLVGRGKIGIKPNIQLLKPKSVLFEDGTEEQIDIIIYATGYKISFPFLDKEIWDNDYVEQTNDVSLYRYVVHPEHKNLFFIGLVQPLGAVMPLAEVQSQWVAKLLTKEVALPSIDYMYRSINEAKQAMRKRYVHSKRHTIQVDFVEYKVSIQREMQRMKTGKRF